MPKDLDIAGSLSEGITWTRCIKTDLDWQQLKKHLAAVLGQKGYLDTTETWPLPKEFDELPSEFSDNFLVVYSAPGDFRHVLAMNIGLVRKYGASANTAGDYIVMAGFDNSRKRKK